MEDNFIKWLYERTSFKAKSGVRVGGVFEFKCFNRFGNLKWEDVAENLVVTEGLNHILDILFAGDESANANIDPWYVGLTDGTPTVAAGDTLASHAGWVEITDYTGTRKEYVDVRTDQTVSNTASKASFAINATVTIGGAFLCSVTSGTSGTLLCAVVFTGGDKSADDGDTLEVTYTFSAADDGA